MKESSTNFFKIGLRSEIRRIITGLELKSMGLVGAPQLPGAGQRARQKMCAVLKASFSLTENDHGQDD